MSSSRIVVSLGLLSVGLAPMQALNAQTIDHQEASRFGMTPEQARLVIANVLAQSAQLRDLIAENRGLSDELNQNQTEILNLYSQIEILRKEANSLDAYSEQLIENLYQLLRRDAEFDPRVSAFVSVVEKGVLGFAESENPRVVLAFQEFLDGDLNALLTLQELVYLELEAVSAQNDQISASVIQIERNRHSEAEANARRSAAIQLRYIASSFSEAVQSGQSTTRQALTSWQEAAELDGSDFWQWVNIANLAGSIGERDIERDAVLRTAELAKSDYEKVTSLNLQYDLDPRLTESTSSPQPNDDAESALQIYRDRYHQDPENIQNNVNLMRQLNVVAINYVNRFQSVKALYHQERPEYLSKAESYLDEYLTLAGGLFRITGRSMTDFDGGYEFNSTRAYIKEVKHDWENARSHRLRALQHARRILETAPDDVVNQSRVIHQLESLARLGGDVEDTLSLYAEAATIAQEHYDRDSEVLGRALRLLKIQLGRGRLARRVWRLDIAESALTSALPAARQWAEYWQLDGAVLEVLPLLAEVKLSSGKIDEAKSLYLEAVDMGKNWATNAEHSGNRDIEISSFGMRNLRKLAEIELIVGEPSKSIEIYREFGEIARRQEQWATWLGATLMRARISLHTQGDDTAIALLADVVAEAEVIEQSEQLAPDMRNQLAIVTLLARMTLADIPTSGVRWNMLASEADALLSLKGLLPEPRESLMLVKELIELRASLQVRGDKLNSLERHILTTNSAFSLIQWAEEESFARLTPVLALVQLLQQWSGSTLTTRQAHDLYESLYVTHTDDIGFALALTKGKLAAEAKVY